MFWGFQEFLENLVLGSKIRFSAQMSNNAKKYIETPRKHQQNMFWGFLRNSWKSGSRLNNVVLSTDFELNSRKSGSRLKNPVLGSDFELLKYLETLRKHQINMLWGFFWEGLENPVLGSTMWFSAQISNYAKLPWNTQKTPAKHALRHFEKF